MQVVELMRAGCARQVMSDRAQHTETPPLHPFWLFLNECEPATASLLLAVDESARMGADRHRDQRARVEQCQPCCACPHREKSKWRASEQRGHPYGGCVRQSP